MRRLVCACVVRKPPKTGFLASRPNYMDASAWENKTHVQLVPKSHFRLKNRLIHIRACGVQQKVQPIIFANLLLCSRNMECDGESTEGSLQRAVSVTSLNPEGSPQCNTHRKRMKFFCTKHELLLCSICAVKRHRLCEEVKHAKMHVMF